VCYLFCNYLPSAVEANMYCILKSVCPCTNINNVEIDMNEIVLVKSVPYMWGHFGEQAYC